MKNWTQGYQLFPRNILTIYPDTSPPYSQDLGPDIENVNNFLNINYSLVKVIQVLKAWPQILAQILRWDILFNRMRGNGTFFFRISSTEV